MRGADVVVAPVVPGEPVVADRADRDVDGRAAGPIAVCRHPIDGEEHTGIVVAADVGDERTPLVSASVGLSTEDNNKSDEPEQEIKEAELQAAEETGESHTGEEV